MTVAPKFKLVCADKKGTLRAADFSTPEDLEQATQIYLNEHPDKEISAPGPFKNRTGGYSYIIIDKYNRGNTMARDPMSTTNEITIKRAITKTGKSTLIIRITDIANVLNLNEGDEVEITLRKL